MLHYQILFVFKSENVNILLLEILSVKEAITFGLSETALLCYRLFLCSLMKTDRKLNGSEQKLLVISVLFSDTSTRRSVPVWAEIWTHYSVRPLGLVVIHIDNCSSYACLVLWHFWHFLRSKIFITKYNGNMEPLLQARNKFAVFSLSNSIRNSSFLLLRN